MTEQSEGSSSASKKRKFTEIHTNESQVEKEQGSAASEEDAYGDFAAKGKKYRNWFITGFHFERKTIEEFVNKGDGLKHALVGFEVCPETKRPHYHLVMNCKGPQLFTKWQKIFEKAKIKWIVEKDYKKVMNYCRKDKDIVEFGNYVSRGDAGRKAAQERVDELEEYREYARLGAFGEIPESELRQYYNYYHKLHNEAIIERAKADYEEYVRGEWKDRQFKVWQKTILKELENSADARKIIWVYDSKGGAGKTQFSQYLELEKDAQVFTPGKSNDLAHLLHPGKPIYILDVPRVSGEHVPWGFIESVKNGKVISGKYEGCDKKFRPPHVIVMSNSAPPECTDKSGFSMDRIQLITL